MTLYESLRQKDLQKGRIDIKGKVSMQRCWSAGAGGKSQQEMALQVLNGKVLALEQLYTK
jgi:hypothetical protein